VKRVIGLPGETLQIWRGHVYINRHLLNEPYLLKRMYTCPVEGRKISETLVLKEGQYAVLGDNRTCSTDSRFYGPVNEDQLKRRVPLPNGFMRASVAQSLTTLPTPALQPRVTK
jgi:signal peptidase I